MGWIGAEWVGSWLVWAGLDWLELVGIDLGWPYARATLGARLKPWVSWSRDGVALGLCLTAWHGLVLPWRGLWLARTWRWLLARRAGQKLCGSRDKAELDSVAWCDAEPCPRQQEEGWAVGSFAGVGGGRRWVGGGCRMVAHQRRKEVSRRSGK